MSNIGLLREGPLHASIKQALGRPGDRFEVPVGRFVIDLVRTDGDLVEVQTGSFSALGPKLDALLDEHRFRIVYPVAAERRIVRVDQDGAITSARRSPKRAGFVEVFEKLVSFPALLGHPHLTVEVLLLREDHVRSAHVIRRGRRTRDPGQRRLIEMLDRVELRGPQDVIDSLPELPAEPFTTRELASCLGCGLVLAQRAAYCLRALGITEPAGKRGRAPLHAATGLEPPPAEPRASVRPAPNSRPQPTPRSAAAELLEPRDAPRPLLRLRADEPVRAAAGGRAGG